MSIELEKEIEKYVEKRKEENYVNKEGVCQTILRYIGKEKSEYAILIDGKWGSGKTFFVRNELKDRIEETNRYKGIIYISLYGLKDIEYLEYRLIYAIIENSIIKKENKISKILLEGTKNYIDSINRRNSIVNIIKLLQNINRYIIIFDDLERCMIPIVEILGYINELIENRNVKIILVANEEKIDDKSKIYDNVKEKLIGEIIYYNPNLKDIISCICETQNNRITKKLILNNENEIIKIMQMYDYKNIRTLKICVSKLEIIVNKMEEIRKIYKSYDESRYNELLNNILIYLLHVTIMFKENMQLYDWSNVLGSFGIINLNINNERMEILGFEFVDKLVKYSITDVEGITEVLELYKKKDQNDIYGVGTPFEIVTNFFGKKDKEIEIALKK